MDEHSIDELSVPEWLDRHQVNLVRTHATTLDGPAVGKYLNRPHFEKALPAGHGISDIALAMDLAGVPHLDFWHEFRQACLGDIMLRPDISTLVPDGKEPNLCHCICDFTLTDGSEISLCPRTLLHNITQKVASAGYSVRASFELEFFLYKTSFADARSGGYKNLEPIGASSQHNIYLLKNAYHASAFMDRVVKRLDQQGIGWESWNDEGGAGQVELNFIPTDPVRAADIVSRTRQMIYEVAVDLDMAVTFMAQPGNGVSNGLHIHHSLQSANGEPAFYDAAQAPGGRSALLLHWIAGIVETMPGAASYLCPSINSWRRLKEFASPPVTASWGEENKTSALRIVSRSAELSRIEHRLAAGDANPYLTLAVILAGGMAGLTHRMEPPDELLLSGWGLPDNDGRLPRTMTTASKALQADRYLAEILGQDVVDYWIKSRRSEWLTFHRRKHRSGQKQGKELVSGQTTVWEFERYFELI